jgi:N6-L-threonylcarbamoyladenine synthase
MVLGIDTSCYRTSVALAQGGRIIAQAGRLLDVPLGERGLRQSEALFQHIQNLPCVIEELMAQGDGRICAVCASASPRPAEGSYMPVFLAGASFARSLCAALGAEFIATTHQQGHVRAALYGSALRENLIAIHLSGGTTELLRVGQSICIERLGGTSDISAGQLVDRIGVAMGLGFPAGPELEALAASGSAQSRLPVSVKGLDCSFSGAESALLRLLAEGLSHGDAAAEVYSLIARTLSRLIAEASRRTGLYDVLIAGGVASSALLRALLPGRLSRLGAAVRVHWAKPELSGDNAAGVALIGCDRRKEECA